MKEYKSNVSQSFGTFKYKRNLKDILLIFRFFGKKPCHIPFDKKERDHLGVSSGTVPSSDVISERYEPYDYYFIITF